MNLQVLRNIDLFRNLDPVQLAHLASIMEERPFKRNAILFEEGDQAEYFYVIAKGRVRISKMIPGIGEEALAILDEGTYFGEMELIDDTMPRAARATAHEDCILQLFRVADFHTIFSADRDLALAILWGMTKTLASRLKATGDKVTAMFALAQFK